MWDKPSSDPKNEDLKKRHRNREEREQPDCHTQSKRVEFVVVRKERDPNREEKEQPDCHTQGKRVEFVVVREDRKDQEKHRKAWHAEVDVPYGW